MPIMTQAEVDAEFARQASQAAQIKAYQTGLQQSSQSAKGPSTLDYISGISSGIAELGKAGITIFGELSKISIMKDQIKSESSLAKDRLKFEQSMAKKQMDVNSLVAKQQQQQMDLAGMLTSMQQPQKQLAGFSPVTVLVAGGAVLLLGFVLLRKK